MRLTIDQAGDVSHRELYNVLKFTGLPDFVKEAELDTPETLQGLNKEAFADPDTRRFPVDTAARTFISNAFLQTKKAALTRSYGASFVEKVQSGIDKAAEIFGIQNDLQKYAQDVLAEFTRDTKPVAVANVKIASQAGGDAIEVEMFKVATPEGFTKAASFFNESLSNYPFHVRREVAEAFILKAASYQVDELPDLLCKYAGLYFPGTREELQKLAWYRSTKLPEDKQTEYRERFQKQAADVISTEAAFDLARDMYQYEQEAGLYRNAKVAALIGDPVDKVFSNSVEKMAQMMDVVEMAGELYSMDSLQKISASVYKEAFGIDLDPTKKGELREVLPTIPRSDVELFKELSGIDSLN